MVSVDTHISGLSGSSVRYRLSQHHPHRRIRRAFIVGHHLLDRGQGAPVAPS
jgi:hypothetical protein